MRLCKVVRGLGVRVGGSVAALEISSVAAHTDRVKEGCLFVCIGGDRFSADRFVSLAISRGAVAFLVDCDVEIPQGYVKIKVASCRRALPVLLSNIYNYPQKSLKIIAVTGTKGKTTTAHLLSECLRGVGCENLLISTMGVFISGKLLYKCENTTPSAEIIFSAMKEARERGVGYVVLEVSSQAVLKDRVAGLRFELCVFTGFSPDHVGGSEHASMEDYFECKRRIFTDHGANIAVVNADDERAADIASGISEVIGCTSRTNGKMQISDIETHKSGIRFILNGTSVSLSMLGEYNAMNAALALSAASRLMGKEVASFLAAIERVRLKGRFERYAVGGAEVVIDFAHNGDSFRAVLGAAARLYPGRIIALFGSVGERSLQRRAELAAEAERAADFSIITSDDPGREPPEKIAGQIYSAFSDRSRAVVITDREAAIRYGVSMLGDGDALLLLGKGQEEYQMIGFERIRFSEREIIASLGAVPI